MKVLALDQFSPTLRLLFLKKFKFARGTSGIHGSSTMWLFHSFINKFAFAVLNAWVGVNSTDIKSFWKSSCTSRCLTTYFQLEIFLVAEFVTNEIIAETQSAITRFAKPAKLKSFKTRQKLGWEILLCGEGCEQYRLNKIFTEGLVSSIP